MPVLNVRHARTLQLQLTRHGGRQPASEAEALTLLEEQISKLITDGGAADRAYKRLKPEPDKKKKK